MHCLQIIHRETGQVRLLKLGVVSTKTKEERIGFIVECNEEEVETPDPTIQPTIHSKNAPVVRMSDKIKQDHHELQQLIGPGLGDLIKKLLKPIAKMTGKENCGQCEARRLIANAYGTFKAKYGMVKALRMVKDLTVMNSTVQPNVLLDHLRTLIQDAQQLDPTPETDAKKREVRAKRL